jgi:quercetin dioxygenase-like cupin family protein
MRRFSVLLSVVMLVGSLLVGGGRLVAAQDASPAAGDEEWPPEGVTFEFLGGGYTESLPSAPANMYLVRLTIQPGASVPGEADDPSLILIVVESGAVTVNLDAPITVLHATANQEPTDNDFEQVPAGQDVTMEQGDSAILPANTTGEVRNDGTENAVLLGAIVEPGDQDEGGATPAA